MSLARRSPRPDWTLDREKYRPQIEAELRGGLKLDMTNFQERLSSGNASLERAAIDELKVLKGIIQDSKSMRQEDLEKKYKQSVWVGRLATAMSIGLTLGAAAFSPEVVTDLHTAIANRGAEAVSNAAADVLKGGVVNQAANVHSALNSAIEVAERINETTQAFNVADPLLERVKRRISLTKLFTKKKILTSPKPEAPAKSHLFSPKIALKIALPITLLVFSTLSGPGVVITVLAVTSTAVKIGANVAGARIKDSLQKLELSGDGLIQMVDEMIQNHGRVWHKEESGLFAGEKSVKNRINAVLNEGTVKTSENILGTFSNTNRKAAKDLLNAMIANAANTSYNAAFETELMKSVEMEGAKEENVQRLRNRRARLRQLASVGPVLQNEGLNDLTKEFEDDEIQNINTTSQPGSRSASPTSPTSPTSPSNTNSNPTTPRNRRARTTRKSRRSRKTRRKMRR